jgi:hypothetical protein
LTKVNERLLALTHEFDKLGNPLPETDEAKTAFTHNLLTNFTRSLCDALNNRGSQHDAGRSIKEILIAYRQTIRTENPFLNIAKNRKLIETTIHNSAGNHMTSPSPPIEVLEQCLRDIKSQPMMKLSGSSHKCIKDVCDTVMCLIDVLLKSSPIYRFPTLYKKIKSTLNGYYIIDLLEKTRQSLADLMQREENYIWTDDSAFHELLGNANAEVTTGSSVMTKPIAYLSSQNTTSTTTTAAQNMQNYSKQSIVKPVTKSNPNIVVSMNKLLREYYNTYIDIMANALPKIIMYDFIYQMQNILMYKFNENILKISIDDLLEENGDRARQRAILTEERHKLQNIKKVIQDI